MDSNITKDDGERGMDTGNSIQESESLPTCEVSDVKEIAVESNGDIKGNQTNDTNEDTELEEIQPKSKRQKVTQDPEGEVENSEDVMKVQPEHSSEYFSKETDNGNESLDISKDESFQKSESSEGIIANNNPKNVKELTEICSKSNREDSCFITSEIPDICKQKPCILGIDEAGRGPVLGPMVYGVCYCPKSKEDDLKETGCADSKSLTEEKRETIFDKICKHGEYIGWEVELISPKVISTSMLRRTKVSLNEVSHNSAIGLLRRALDAGVLVSEVFVDTVGPAEKYEAKLKNLFPELSITVAKKADATYPIVGGASICAKVTRDVALKSWTFSEIDSSGEWGSGYPNDPVTKKFLSKTMDPIFGFPNIVRFSWSTAEKILEENAVQVDWEEEESTKTAPSVKSFFSPGDQKQHRFFKDRCLKNIASL